MGLKQAMRMIGLTSRIYWSSWFFRFFIALLLPFSIICILMSTSFFPLYEYSNPILIWIFLVLYISSIVTYGFLMSVLFRSPAVAVNVGWLFFVFAILFYSAIDENFGQYSYVVRVLFALLINANMGIGIDLILYFEKYREGVRFKNLFERDVVMNFSLGELLICMLLATILQILMTLYIERVFPGDFGIAEPWNFPFKKLVLFVKKLWNRKKKKQLKFNSNRASSFGFEEEPRTLKVGIKIDKLGKIFDGKVQIRDLTMSIYESQITILLGKD